MPYTHIITPRAHARSGVKQWVLSISVSVSVSVCQCVSVSVCQCVSVSVCQCVSVSVCHQNFGLITTTKGLYTSKRHSNSGNSDKT